MKQVLLFFVLLVEVYSLNLRPIIGIVSEKKTGGGSYIAASYVKYIESAGGQVVPIFNNASQDDLRYLFNSINGVLFPGGGVSLNDSDYLDVGKIMFELAKEANDKGDYFPLWGTCLGFQLLCVLQAGTDKVLHGIFDSENYSIPLNFTDAAYQSRLYSSYTVDSMRWLATEPLTMNNHHFGVTPQKFQSSQLNQFYDVLSTNVDREGKQFVSSMEAIKYPFYGTQWHPEKNIFEWTTKEGINHSYHAVVIAQTAANFFVNEARKSEHHFDSVDEEASALIYNYPVTYTGQSSNFEQIYFF